MAKKTVYVAKTASTLTARRSDVEKLKRAFTKMMDEYVRLKEQQRRFEAAAAELCGFWLPWTIPFRKVESWKKELRRR